jgi:hypothetical protein
MITAYVGSATVDPREVLLRSSPPHRHSDGGYADADGVAYGWRILRVSDGVLRAYDTVAGHHSIHFTLDDDEIEALRALRVEGRSDEIVTDPVIEAYLVSLPAECRPAPRA